MTTSGMYDYAGEWIYRVGIPAKSGVGGGILAALPARLGLGSYSPRLDRHGNSVRGIKVCEALSSHYDLHMLNRSDDARNAIIADYNIGKQPIAAQPQAAGAETSSPRIRTRCACIELVGTLSFSNVDYVSRQLAARPRPQFVIFDLRRVTAMTPAGARLLVRSCSTSSRSSMSPSSCAGVQSRVARNGRRSPNAPTTSPMCATSICSTPRSNGPRTRSSTAMAARSIFTKPPKLPNSRCWPG